MTRARALVTVVVVAGLALPWLGAVLLHATLTPPMTSLLAGLAILSGSILLTWGVEVAEHDLPGTLSITLLALLAVLPEYAVDATYAWSAARDPESASYATANMTGANRLLVGVGWAAVFLVMWWKKGRSRVELGRDMRLDIAVLGLATLYSLVPALLGRISLIDTVVLVSLYGTYVVLGLRIAKREPDADEEAGGVSATLGELPRAGRLGVVASIFVYSGAAILFAAGPFAHGLVATGKGWGVDEFLLVQWVAPLASEAPELIVAIVLAAHGKAQLGLRALVSSKVNQWTLLVGTLPLVSSLGARRVVSLPLDVRQKEELLLTISQSSLAVVMISSRDLRGWEALVLLALFIGQVASPTVSTRTGFTAAYVVLTVILLASSSDYRKGIVAALRFLVTGAQSAPDR